MKFMMVWKMVGGLIIIMMVIFSFAMVFNEFPQKPVRLEANHKLEASHISEGNNSVIGNQTVPVFGKNMRFNHNLISYFISSNCDYVQREKMVSAFSIFSRKVKVVAFYDGNSSSDIKVYCSSKFVKMGADTFAAGEGGPSEIINTTKFKVIKKGKIILYNERSCDYPVVELHELGHVFGFAHSKNPENIMFNTSNCNQRMSEGLIAMVRKLYSVKPLGDAKIEKVTGVIKGGYLDFNISVLNEGLIDIPDINLTIFSDNRSVDIIDLGNIKIGYGRTLKVKNIRVPSETKRVKFVVDAENNIRELDKTNNVVIMSAIN